MKTTMSADQATAGKVETSDGVLCIDGRQAYWYDSLLGIAWNSCTEWVLTAEQIATCAELPGLDASKSRAPSKLYGSTELPGGIKTY